MANWALVVDVPGYRLMERLGIGSLGQVFRAVQLRTEEEVAVRVLRTSQGLDSQFKRWASCHHPSLVAPVDAAGWQDPPYIATPYFKTTLANSALAPRPGHWLRELAEGLQYLHDRGLFHLNLKPENVVIDQLGNARMIDFGQTFLRPEGGDIGSFWFMPPEQTQGGAPNPSWDVYALGATIYAAVNGQPPRLDARIQEALEQSSDVHYQLELYRRSLAACKLAPLKNDNARLKEVVERCLSLVPGRRFQDCGQVLQALQGGSAAGTPLVVAVGVLLAGVACAAVVFAGSRQQTPVESAPPGQAVAGSPAAPAGAVDEPPAGGQPAPPEQPAPGDQPAPEQPATPAQPAPAGQPPPPKQPTDQPTPKKPQKKNAGPTVNWRDLGVQYTFPDDYVPDERGPGLLGAHNRSVPSHRIVLRCEQISYPNWRIEGWTPLTFTTVPHGRTYVLKKPQTEALKVFLFQNFKQLSLQVEKKVGDNLDLTAFFKQAAAGLTMDGKAIPQPP